MFLSRIVLNMQSSAAIHALSDSHAMHRLVYAAFPNREVGGPGRVLYRLEVDSQSGRAVVLAQSELLPAWQPLGGPRGVLCSAECKEFQPVFRSGQGLRFRLRANPTVRKWEYRGESADGKRVGIYDENCQLEWLARKAALSGFRVVESAATDNGCAFGRRPAGGGDMQLRHVDVTFDGILAVADVERFADAVRSGIGTAKGFGFGLLSVARV